MKKQLFTSIPNLNPAFLCVILSLISIPLFYEINSVCISLLLIVSVFLFKKENISFQKALLLPIGLYVLMFFSLFWTIDKNQTIPALSKELSLLTIPVCFMLFGGYSIIQKSKIIQFYSLGMVGFCVFYLLNALFNYYLSADRAVFFYHQLVTKDVNAIHASVFMALAFIYFFTKTTKTKIDFLSIGLLFITIILLSAKNIQLVLTVLIIIYFLYFYKTANQLRLKNLAVFALIITLLFSFNKIKNRFNLEFQTHTNKSINANVVEKQPVKTHIVSIKEAWSNQSFTPNDFFPGTAFRIYQFRIFIEMVQEDAIFWTGYGLNASYSKIEQKAHQYNLYLGNQKHEGYQKKNFHNQLVQNFAELGVFGFLILIAMLFINLKNALQNKNFIHFSFAILMISLLLTETFLWRQRGVVFFTIFYCLFNSKEFQPT